MAFSLASLVPGTELTTRNVLLAFGYSAVLLIGYGLYLELAKPKSKPIDPALKKLTQETADRLAGTWEAEPEAATGFGSDLVAPTTRKLFLSKMEPKADEPSHIISGSYVIHTPLSTKGNVLMTALEIFGLEGADAADLPQSISLPRYFITGNLAFGTKAFVWRHDSVDNRAFEG